MYDVYEHAQLLCVKQIPKASQIADKVNTGTGSTSYLKAFTCLIGFIYIRYQFYVPTNKAPGAQHLEQLKSKKV